MQSRGRGWQAPVKPVRQSSRLGQRTPSEVLCAYQVNDDPLNGMSWAGLGAEQLKPLLDGARRSAGFWVAIHRWALGEDPTP